MSFCKFSPSQSGNNKTLVDNVFINEYLPSAPDVCVKVYLLGLSMCGLADEPNNSLTYFAKTLNITEDDVVSVFRYWEGLGLVQILNISPIEVRYLPVISNAKNIKKYKVDKYASFNITVQELFAHKMVMPNEFAEFYNLIENKHMEEDALLAIIKYCVDSKGFALSPNYCIVVAKNWLSEGIHTLQEVTNKIAELGNNNENVNLILSAMGSKRKAQLEDVELLKKWLDDYKFELNVIIYVCKSYKLKKKHISFDVLDEVLSKYYELKLLSIAEIENYENELTNMQEIAKTINRQLGLRYDDLSKEIDTYVLPWLNMGFDFDTLNQVADNCYLSSIRTLNGFDAIIKKLYKLGITNVAAYNEYLSNNLAVENLIKEVLSALELNRNIIAQDRLFFHTWRDSWGFGQPIILHAASFCKGKTNPMQYLNKVLADWHSRNLKPEEIMSLKPTDLSSQNFTHNNYTKEQIQSLITNLDEVEV